MKIKRILSVLAALALLCILLFFGVRIFFPRPFRDTVKTSGLDSSLVYSVIKAESGFDESAKSNAGAIGLMQLRPSTAKFICEREDIVYSEERLTEGEYNVRLGCLYLNYLLTRFSVMETALAAYNAGEGTVSEWLLDAKYSDDGATLKEIPYPETKAHVKKVEKFRKIYEFLY